MKTVIENSKILHWIPPRVLAPKKARKLSSLAIEQWEHRCLTGRKVWNKTLSGFSGVATGNWSCGMKQFGGRMFGRPRVSCGLLLNIGPIIFINFLRLCKSPASSLTTDLSEIIIYIQILCTKKQPGFWKLDGPTPVQNSPSCTSATVQTPNKLPNHSSSNSL